MPAHPRARVQELQVSDRATWTSKHYAARYTSEGAQSQKRREEGCDPSVLTPDLALDGRHTRNDALKRKQGSSATDIEDNNHQLRKDRNELWHTRLRQPGGNGRLWGHALNTLPHGLGHILRDKRGTHVQGTCPRGRDKQRRKHDHDGRKDVREDSVFPTRKQQWCHGPDRHHR
eukprot:CAMPEP_0194498624 /NCGR_PEP_ID=MMETSP0253-20130528/15199_1 /TAXON_ID=2966 /ORGANISM="Noctiluca scintillans" /LENGTH=173 /DNA_ID=CAMNT_0039340291 /DNA_START=13 /DNA_END=535 /DNA_ORIENTATION=+